MGLFNKVFKTPKDIAQKEIVEVPWHALTDIQQLDKIEEESTTKTIAIYKHSTRCGISRMVLNSFEKDFDLGKEEGFKLYFLDLLANRNVSNEVANKFNVRHESPQLIILKNKKVVHHASHHAVKVESLKEYI